MRSDRRLSIQQIADTLNMYRIRGTRDSDRGSANAQDLRETCAENVDGRPDRILSFEVAYSQPHGFYRNQLPSP